MEIIWIEINKNPAFFLIPNNNKQDNTKRLPRLFHILNDALLSFKIIFRFFIRAEFSIYISYLIKKNQEMFVILHHFLSLYLLFFLKIVLKPILFSFLLSVSFFLFPSFSLWRRFGQIWNSLFCLSFFFPFLFQRILGFILCSTREERYMWSFEWSKSFSRLCKSFSRL